MPDPLNDFIGVSQIAMLAHTTSVANAAEMRVHRDECAATRLRNENAFIEIRETIHSLDGKMDASSEKMATKMDTKHEELKKEIGSSNRWLYMIVGGITLAGAVFGKIPFHL